MVHQTSYIARGELQSRPRARLGALLIMGLAAVGPLSAARPALAAGQTQPPSSANLVVSSPSTLELPNTLTATVSAVGAQTNGTYTWRKVSGPGDVWFKPVATANPSASGKAIVTALRSGTYQLEVTTTISGGSVSKQWTVTVNKPTAVQARLEGQFAIRNVNRAGAVGPRIISERGDIYLTYVDPDLNTVVSKKPLGSTAWQTATVASGTKDEEDHNKPALGIDKDGYLHIVYDMHSGPWRYKVSTNPRDISAWSDRSGGPNENDASPYIPGRQITYPWMAKSPSGDLWMSFRECYDCTQSNYHARKWSAGLVKYNPSTGVWDRAGGVFPFALGDTYRPQYVRIAFDSSGKMLLGWIWGLQYTFNEGSAPFFNSPNYPSFAQSTDGVTFKKADGTSFNLPITFDTAEKTILPQSIDPTLAYRTGQYFNSLSDVTTQSDGNPMMVARSHWTKYSANGWSQAFDNSSKTPGAGYVYRYGANGDLIAVSSNGANTQGVTLYRSRDNGATWKSWSIDTSPNNELGLPDYYIDDDYFAQAGGEAMRLVLLYDHPPTPTAPAAKIYTVQFPNT